MEPDDIMMRVDYFHAASDEHLAVIGVDRARLPAREGWSAALIAGLTRRIIERSDPASRRD